MLEKWGTSVKSNYAEYEKGLDPEWIFNKVPVEITDVIECPEKDRLRWRNKVLI